MFKKFTSFIVFCTVFCLFFAGSVRAQTISLVSGWNLVSSRIEITASDTSSDSINFASIWMWEDNKWAVYLPGECDGGAAYAASKGFSVLENINPGEGFWVNSVGAQSITVTGAEVTSDTISLGAGWNLKGLQSNEAKSITDLISGNEGDILSVWKWEGNNWAVWIPPFVMSAEDLNTYISSEGFAMLEAIYPGEGFYVCTPGSSLSTPPTPWGFVKPVDKGVDVVQQDISLVTGWNLISLTYQPVDNSVVSLISGNENNVVSIWKFDSTNNRWSVFLPDGGTEAYATAKGLSILNEISVGEGMWLNCAAAFTLTYSGNESLSKAISYTSKGWNLIGLKENTTVAAGDLIAVNDKVNGVAVWKWVSGVWAVYISGNEDLLQQYVASKGFYALSEISPGEGFYIKNLQEEIYSNWEPDTPPSIANPYAPPRDFTATPGNGSVTLSWTPFEGIETLTGYRIQQNDGTIITTKELGPGESTVKLAGLLNGKKYEYKINSILEMDDGLGGKYHGFNSDVISATPKDDLGVTNSPPAITFLAASSDIIYEGSSITFQWIANDSDGNVVGYLYSLDDDTLSSFTTSTKKSFNNPGKGQHTFYVKAKDNNGAFSAISSKIITVTEKEVSITDYGQLILVVGGPTNQYDNLWPKLKPLADKLYDTFLKRGFTSQDIFFMQKAESVTEKIDDASPSVDDIHNAIKTWAGGSSKEGPLFIFMLDHGSTTGVFYLSETEVITAAQLGAFIDEFLSANRHVVLVIEACYSGVFKDKIEAENVVVISSASNDKSANVSQNVSFTKLFTMMIGQGYSIKQAFDIAKLELDKSIPPFSEQNPQIGDLAGLSDSIYVAGDFASAGDVFPVVTNASVDNLIPKNGEVVKFSAELTGNTENISRVWAVITPPDFTSVEIVDYNVPDPNLITVNLGATVGNHYEAYYQGFVKNGAHNVVILASNDDGDIGISNSFTVTVNGESIDCPSNVTNLMAQAGDGQVILTWTKDENATGYMVYFKQTGGYYGEGLDVGNVSIYTLKGLTNGTLYTFKVTSIKEGCDETAGAIISMVPGESDTIQYNIFLNSAWNLVSLPVTPVNSLVTSLLSDISSNIASTWKWETGNWAVWIPESVMSSEQLDIYIGDKGFVLLENINCGEGFWVNSSTDQTLTVSGTQPSNTSCSLTDGWNLIGLKTSETKSINDLISDKESDISSVWKWEDNKWAVYLPGESDGGAAYAASKDFSVLEDINPGEGFWVNATQQITLK